MDGDVKMIGTERPCLLHQAVIPENDSEGYSYHFNGKCEKYGANMDTSQSMVD